MFFKQLFDPASSTLTYLIADDSNHEAVLIDPVTEQVERDVRLLREHGLALKYTLETHVHADHVTAAHALKQATGAQTAVCRDCNAQGYDRLLKDGDVILFGHEEILTIATPGHTPGSVSYLWRDRVFTGDTLLIGGCGRTDFQNGSAEALRAPGVHLLDGRTPEEFEAIRIAGAVNVPLDRLDPAALLARMDANDPVYVVCQTGTRSQFAAAELRAAGFRRVVHVDGGTNAWTVAGLPVARGSARV